MTVGNANVTIRVGSPLLRPGLTIETTVSESYAVNAAQAMLDLARGINKKGKSE